MKYIVVLAAAVALAGCGGSVREQAEAQCAEQTETMSGTLQSAGVDPEEFCTCILADIDDSSTISEANDAITGRTQQCVSEAIQSAEIG
ncbi:MAG: hypothetical protein AAGE05_00795 [Pseudomonadota bacterium]